MILVGFASSGVLLSAGTAAIAGLLNIRIVHRMRAAQSGPAMPRMAPAILAVAPIVVLSVQSALVDAVATSGRNLVIANSATLIAEIEQYRARHGAYPVSILAVWGDYKPSIVGVERYHYEPSGDAHNVIFEEPSLGFGTRRFVVYNPRDEQSMTSHEQDRLRLEGEELEAASGGRVVLALRQPNWKVFLFLS